MNTFRDDEGSENFYQAISVIEFKGIITSRGESQGHYICDVKDVSTNMWYRTDDNVDPIQLQEINVSKQGYVILYKRM